VLPSLLALLALSWLYALFGASQTAAAVLDGVKPVVLAIVVAAVWRLGRRSLRTPLDATLGGLALVAIAALGVPFPAIVALAALVGFLAAPASQPPPTPAPRPSFTRLVRLALAGLALWVVPAAALLAAGQDFVLRLYLFFTRAAFVTFGGAYAVLAYVAAHATQAGWLTPEAMVDGLALAETTPGPLIIVLVFVGFLSAWNIVGPGWAAVGALATAWATFLPSTWIALAIGPYVERLAALPRVRRALGAVTAAVVGVIGSLAIVLGRAVLVAPSGGLDLFALLLALAALALLVRGLEPHWAVVGGAAVGLISRLGS
jgi:chromate transporter